MAEMNGWEFAERLRAIDPRVPLLFITGWGLREEDHARLAGLGVQPLPVQASPPRRPRRRPAGHRRPPLMRTGRGGRPGRD